MTATARATAPHAQRRSRVSSRHPRAAAGLLLLLAAPGLIALLGPGTAVDTVRHADPVAPASIIESLPVALDIPAIDVSGPVTDLGLDPDGAVELPPNDQVAGWYRYGPAPGDPGAAVILGHIDSYTGPAVFFRLSSLRPGDQIDVTRADRSVAHFLVHTVASYPKTQFPTHEVYDSQGFSALQLVTCGGEFDHAARSYLSNTVVYSALVGVTFPFGAPPPL